MVQDQHLLHSTHQCSHGCRQSKLRLANSDANAVLKSSLARILVEQLLYESKTSSSEHQVYDTIPTLTIAHGQQVLATFSRNVLESKTLRLEIERAKTSLASRKDDIRGLWAFSTAIRKNKFRR